MQPTFKSLTLDVVLTLALIASWILTKPVPLIAIPLSIFYALLVFNTYFSVKFFARIIRPSFPQSIMDCLLIILYLLMAWNIGNSLLFGITLTVFFTLATLKYVQLMGILGKARLLRRKIAADCMGIFLGPALVLGIIYGHEIASLWILVIIFGLANIWTLRISPLYRSR